MVGQPRRQYEGGAPSRRRALAPGPGVLGYLRQLGDAIDAVLLNLSATPVDLDVPAEVGSGRVLVSTHAGRAGARLGGRLQADEAVVVAVRE